MVCKYFRGLPFYEYNATETLVHKYAHIYTTRSFPENISRKCTLTLARLFPRELFTQSTNPEIPFEKYVYISVPEFPEFPRTSI